MLTFNRPKRQKTFEINCEYDCFLFIRKLKEIYFKIFHEFFFNIHSTILQHYKRMLVPLSYYSIKVNMAYKDNSIYIFFTLI